MWPRLKLSSLIKNENSFLPGVRIKGFDTKEEAQQVWDERLANEPGLSAKVQAQQNSGNHVAPPFARSQNNPTRSSNSNSNGTSNSTRDVRNQHSYPSPSPSVVSQALPTGASGTSARAMRRSSTAPANSELRATLDTSVSTVRGISERTRSWAAQTNSALANTREDGGEDASRNAFSRGINQSPFRQGTVNNNRGSDHQIRSRASVESLLSVITVSSDSPSESVRSVSMVSSQRAGTSKSTPVRQVPPYQQRGDNSAGHTSVVGNNDAKRPLSSPRTIPVRTKGLGVPSTPSSVSSRDVHVVPPTVSSPTRGSERSSGRTDAVEGLQELSVVGLVPNTPIAHSSRNLESARTTVSRGVQTIPYSCQCRHDQYLRRSSTLSNIGFSEPPHMASLVITDPRSPVASGSTLVPGQACG